MIDPSFLLEIAILSIFIVFPFFDSCFLTSRNSRSSKSSSYFFIDILTVTFKQFPMSTGTKSIACFIPSLLRL